MRVAQDRNTSSTQKNTPARITKKNTAAVVITVSCRVGQTTLRNSTRESTTNSQNARPRPEEPNTTIASATPATTAAQRIHSACAPST
jgi:hypothetical protein